MSRRAAVWIGWSIAAVAALQPLLILGVLAADDTAREYAQIGLLAASVAILVGAVVGALIVSRRPASTVGWLFCGFNGYAALTMPPSLLAFVAPERATDGAAQVVAWLSNWAWIVPLPFLIFVLLFFPDDRLPSRRWRGVAWCGVFATLALAAGVAFEPGPLSDSPEIENPFPLDDAVAGALELAGTALSSLVFAAAIAAVVVRYRRAGRTERDQIKLVAAAAPLAAATIIGGFAVSGAGARALGVTLTLAGFVVVPVAIGVAMLRYRLYDVDRLISRSLTYGLVTAVLVAAYTGLVLAGQVVFSSFAGGGDLAIAGSTLVVAALFPPLRSRVQRLVDRRFNRRRYDAQRTLAAFGARLREEVDLGNLTDDLRGVVAETMQPAHASLWLRSGVRS